MRRNFTLYFCLFLLVISHLSASLQDLENQVKRDLDCLNIPPHCWVKARGNECKILDVAIIGGGMAGMTAAFALMREGITLVHIFDENKQGEEGPWKRYARMYHLRSNKSSMGPALGISSLTFRAWYEASFGVEAWQRLKMISTDNWYQYLCWYRRVLDLPLSNLMALQRITPLQDCFELLFACGDEREVVYARKIVLATGREGFGGGETPHYMDGVSKEFYFHTSEPIDPSLFIKKRVVVIGAGASAFDTAAAAIESGAENVAMLVRRANLPLVNKFSKFSFPGILHGFYHLSDEIRCDLFAEAIEAGVPPTKEGVDRIKGARNFQICYGVEIEKVEEGQKELVLHTSKGDFKADLIILGTGFGIDGVKRPELQGFIEYVSLWQEHVAQEILERVPKLGLFPYLGEHFQFQERIKGEASYLKDIYCFNYGAFLSHGIISGDIPGISHGACRLAAGIATDLFVEDIALYEKSIKGYAKPLFDPGDLDEVRAKN